MSKPKPNVIAFQPESILTAWAYEDNWSTSLCECNNDCGELCYSLICCPCYSCHLSWRLRESCYIFFFVPQPIAALRTKVRALFRINGSICNDCMVGLFCPCCAAMQLSRELKIRHIP